MVNRAEDVAEETKGMVCTRRGSMSFTHSLNAFSDELWRMGGGENDAVGVGPGRLLHLGSNGSHIDGKRIGLQAQLCLVELEMLPMIVQYLTVQQGADCLNGFPHGRKGFLDLDPIRLLLVASRTDDQLNPAGRELIQGRRADGNGHRVLRIGADHTRDELRSPGFLCQPGSNDESITVSCLLGDGDGIDSQRLDFFCKGDQFLRTVHSAILETDEHSSSFVVLHQKFGRKDLTCSGKRVQTKGS